MSYFLTNQSIAIGQAIVISGEEARHILLSRRMKPGEQIFIQDKNRLRFLCEVVMADRNKVTIRSIEKASVPVELQMKISLFQAVVNEKAFDLILQKSTELGAAEVVLFNSHHVATKLTLEKFQAKLPRWQKILWEAAKQCDRAQVPELKFLPDVDSIISESKNFDQFIILDASGGRVTTNTYNLKPIAFVVGPEGGLTPKELSRFQSISKSQLTSISPFTLRAETAAIAGLSILQLNEI